MSKPTASFDRTAVAQRLFARRQLHPSQRGQQVDETEADLTERESREEAWTESLRMVRARAEQAEAEVARLQQEREKAKALRPELERVCKLYTNWYDYGDGKIDAIAYELMSAVRHVVQLDEGPATPCGSADGRLDQPAACYARGAGSGPGFGRDRNDD